MTIDPTQPPPTEPAPAPVRKNHTVAITVASVAAVLLLTGAAVAGHGVWSVLAEWQAPTASPDDNGSDNPGHFGSRDLPLDGIDVTPATDGQKVGVVTILTDLYYDENSQAAGTGSILTSDGEILTNNHVIEGSTTIEVTIESSGDTYEAVVLGTDKTNDVALLKLIDASGLDTVDLSFDDVSRGDEVASIGNAQGTGDLVYAQGTVTATNEQLSINDGYGGEYENLTGLIEVDADVVSGDSGGPLVDDDGDVIGMITAASRGDEDIRGYAIPIADAMDIVDQVRAGDESGTVNIGPTAFMGVTIDPDQGTDGVLLDGTIADTPADKAGLVAGDTITAIAGVPVLTVDEIKAEVRSHEPGDVIDVTYFDASGVEHTVQLTLTEGPA